jgi:hypothetical protein
MPENIYQTAWSHLPEDGTLHSSCPENLKSDMFQSGFQMIRVSVQTSAKVDDWMNEMIDKHVIH